MKKLSFIAKVLIAGASLFFCTCSSSPVAGGNSSQTGNAGIVILASTGTVSGRTRPQAQVSIYDSHYMPYLTPSGFCDSTVADDSGRFVFSIAQEGYFNLFVNDLRRGTAGYLPRIPLFADSVFKDTLGVLKQPGFISGNTTDSAGRTYALSYVFIQGSPFYTITRNNGDFQLGPLPSGTYNTGFCANFQVVNSVTGQMVQVASALTDSAVITVFPDSVSHWKW
jgi:hypothetical protein